LQPYKEFKYLYPPRPDNILSYDRIPYYEAQGWGGQYKKNGTCTIVAFSPEGEFIAMNRHHEDHKAWQLTDHIKQVLTFLLPKGYWAMLIGEIMHSKTPSIKDTIYFHDIIVHKSIQLVGMAFEDRQVLLKGLLPQKGKSLYSHYEVDPKIWVANLITKDILQHFLNIKDKTIDEGIVLKKLNGKLKPCLKADSNSSWQYKIRYETKNYQF
jgi:hypothetical protein